MPIKSHKNYQYVGGRQFARMIGKKRGYAVPDVGELGDPIYAEVNWGRWLVQCECAGAEYLDLDDPVFWCLSCNNEAHGGKWRPVVVPPNRVAIEKLLEKRPVKHQHWKPGETLQQLQAENKEHGY